MNNMQKAAKKIALVTGANKGIGLEVARQLGAAGCVVLLGARNVALGEEACAKLAAEGLDVRFVPLDVTSHATIAAAAEKIGANFDRLDILVNNAGIADRGDGSPETAQIDAVERVLRTNFLGALAVTQAMLPLLRRSPAGRIVNVSSGLGSLTRSASANSSSANYFGYSASKAALNMLTVQLARLLSDTAIKVNSAAPGYTATALNDFRGVQTIPEGAAEAVRLALLPDDGPTGTFSERSGIVPW
jgi:NAD(P)-dependent dehydrogenase (short-subunit alcohol dehydrogenase family)